MADFTIFLRAMRRHDEARPLQDRTRAILLEMVDAGPEEFSRLKAERAALLRRIATLVGTTRPSGSFAPFLDATARIRLKEPVETKLRDLDRRIPALAPFDAIALRAHRDRLREILALVDASPGAY